MATKLEKALEFFEGSKRKVVEVNRAERYQKQPGPVAWLERQDSAAGEITAGEKQYGAMIDRADRLNLGDSEVRRCIQTFRTALSMVSKFRQRKEWLEGLTDSDFDHPQMADFDARCGSLNYQLSLCELGPHVREMKSAVVSLEARLVELAAAFEKQGAHFLRREIETVFPQRSETPDVVDSRFSVS